MNASLNRITLNQELPENVVKIVRQTLKHNFFFEFFFLNSITFFSINWLKTFVAFVYKKLFLKPFFNYLIYNVLKKKNMELFHFFQIQETFQTGILFFL